MQGGLEVLHIKATYARRVHSCRAVSKIQKDLKGKERHRRTACLQGGLKILDVQEKCTLVGQYQRCGRTACLLGGVRILNVQENCMSA